MKPSRSFFLVLACLLALILSVIIGGRKTPAGESADNPSGQPLPVAESTMPEELPMAEPVPETAVPEVTEPVAPEVVAEVQVAPEDWVKRTISEEWTDAPDKLAGRQRVRIVEADFKYPMLRLEETVTVDPATGLETAALIRASVADHLMLGLKPGTDPQLAAAAVREMGYHVRAIEPDSYILAELPMFDTAKDQGNAAADLAALEEFIDHAEPDYLVFPCLTPNDPAYSQGRMWGLHNPGTSADSTPDADIDAPEGWAIRKDAPGIVVAVTDTGIQYNHEDLAENMWTHPTNGSHGFDAYDGDNDPMDVGGHGTHCAGTIGARGDNGKGLTGVAWDVQLMAVRFLGPNGGTTSDAIRSVNYSRQNGAHIISASWGGGGYSQGLFNAIKACADAGIPFVAAAGNSSQNNDACPHYPSSYALENIVAVASTTKKDVLSSFSCYGRTSVDLAAPGSAIWSSYTGQNNSYTFLNGTSMATPHVSGALALAMAHFPEEDMERVIARLYGSVDKIPALAGKVATGGRLNLAKLLGGAPPNVFNDHFADAHRFEGHYGTWVGSNAGATREADEDSFSIPGTGNKSLWLAFRTPHAGLVSIDATGEILGFDVVVFEGGAKGQLRQVAHSKGLDGFYRAIRFNAKADTEYRIVCDTYAVTRHRFRVDYSLSPVNDFFADASELSGDFFSVTGSNRGSTEEDFESRRPHAGSGQGKSVWWKWTAPEDGDFIINTSGSAFDTVLAVYTGVNTRDLTEVATSDDRSPLDWTSQVTIPAVAGTTYHIAVDSFREDSAGEITLNGFRVGDVRILKHPENLNARLGSTATMRVVALGNNLSFRWEFNGAPIPGEVSPTLRIQNVAEQDYGTYRARVSDPLVSILSDPATLGEFVIPPGILWQTRSRSISVGENIDLRVRASGTAPFTYQWYRNDIEIEGAESDSLRLEDVDASDEGGYTVVVTNAAGFAKSERIVIRVFNIPWKNLDVADPASQAGVVYAVENHGDDWCAVTGTGDNDGLRLSTSTDGKNWIHTIVEAEHPEREFSTRFLVRGNGFWLAGGRGWPMGTLIAYKSTDGVEWERIQMNVPSGATNILSHEGYLHLLAGSRIYRSLDGVDWVMETSPTGGEMVVSKVIAGQAGLLAGGDNTTQAWFLGNGAGTWQAVTVDPQTSGAPARLTDLLPIGKHFVVYSSLTTGFRSADGLNWEPGVVLPSGVRQATWRAAKGDMAFAGSGAQDFLSTDGGLTWKSYSLLFPMNTRSAAINERGLSVFGGHKGALIAVEDLFAEVKDYPVPMFASAIDDLVYEGGQFIAAYHESVIAVSADGETWTHGRPKNIQSPFPGTFAGNSAPLFIEGEYWRPGFPKQSGPYYPYLRGPVPSASVIGALASAPDHTLVSIAGGPAGIVAIRVKGVDSMGVMVRSVDGGVTWNTITAPGTTPSRHGKLQSVNGAYFYNAYFGSAYVSSDLQNWIDIGDYTHLLHHQGEYWAFHQNWVKKSADLVNWSATAHTGLGWFGKPVSFNGAVVAPLGGKLHYSYDGTNWVRVLTGFRVGHIAASENVLVIASHYGHIARMGAALASAPAVSILEPIEENVFVEGGRIFVNVSAYHPDEDGDPVVRCFYDGAFIGQLGSPPYEFEIPSGGLGGHLIHVECRKGNGPVSLATRHILVQPSHLSNRISDINGLTSLPGQVVYRNGIYIAHDANGFMGSLDGREWHTVTVPVTMANPRGIVEGGGRLVAYGGSPDANFAVTRDGVNWLGGKLPGASLTELRYNHGYFWGVASNGIILSEDGLNWTLRKGMNNPPSFQMAVGNPNGVLLGLVYQSALWRSGDGGRTWATLPGMQFNEGLSYDGSRFFVKTQINGQRMVGSSLDGLAWEWSDPDTRYQQLQVVDGTSFVFGTLDRLVAVSHDGLEWLQVPDEPRVTHVTRGMDGYFHAVVRMPDTGIRALHRSANGLEWEYRAPLPTTETFSMFATPEGLFITPGNGSLWVMEWGTDIWSHPFSSAGAVTSILDVEGGGGKLLSIANNGTRILSSSDGGQSWATAFDLAGSGLPNSLRLTRLMQKGGVWLAWHRGVALLRSEDGVSFSNITGATGAASFGGLAHNGDTWMAIRDDGAVLTSNDGLAWAARADAGAYPDGRAYFLTSHQGTWYAVSPAPSGGWSARLLSSPDGVNWTPTTMPNITSSGAVAFAATNGRMIVGSSEYRYTPDLVTWSNTFANNSIFAHDDAFYLVRNGWVERSANGTGWEKIRQIGNSSYTSGKFIDGKLHLFGGSRIAIITAYDVAVNALRVDAADYAVGDTVDVEFTLLNEGGEDFPGGEYEVDVFLSADNFYGNDDDFLIGQVIVNAPKLLPGESATVRLSSEIPNLTSPGTYSLGVFFDRKGSYQERSAGNNFGMTILQPITIPGWLLSTTAAGNGEINQDGGQRLFANGSVVSLNATAGKGTVFAGWEGDAFSPNNQITILMDGDKSVQANFSNRATLQVFVKGMGEVSGVPDFGSYPLGETAQVTAVPAPGWEFSHWSGASSVETPAASIPMDAPKTATAHFVLPMATWKSARFSAEQLADSAISGDHMDPDGDGIPNWKEYLHGSRPMDKDSTGASPMIIADGYLRCVYTRNVGAEGGASLTCQAGRGLANWDSPDLQERILSTVDGIETVEARIPMAGQGMGFLRFRYIPSQP